MNIGKACAIFEQIESDEYEEQDKLQAIKEVITMPTHNGITKSEIMTAFKWFFNWAVQESSKKQTNADRIRTMNAEEMAMNMMCPNENGLAEIECNRDDSCNCYECLLKWLQAEADNSANT